MTRPGDAGILAVLIRLAEAALGVAFVIASVPKLRFPDEFAGAVFQYRILGASASVVAAIVMPSVELSVGLSLITGLARRAGLAACTALLVLFVFVQAQALARGLNIACACFAMPRGTLGGSNLVSYGTLARTAALLVVPVTSTIAILVRGRHADRT